MANTNVQKSHPPLPRHCAILIAGLDATIHDAPALLPGAFRIVINWVTGANT